jgi:hypothetical protein
MPVVSGEGTTAKRPFTRTKAESPRCDKCFPENSPGRPFVGTKAELPCCSKCFPTSRPEPGVSVPTPMTECSKTTPAPQVPYPAELRSPGVSPRKQTGVGSGERQHRSDLNPKLAAGLLKARLADQQDKPDPVSDDSESDDDPCPPLLQRTHNSELSDSSDDDSNEGRRPVARRRNKKRLLDAAVRDEEILSSKYLPSDAKEFLPCPLVGPDDTFNPPSTLVSNLKKVAQMEVEAPLHPNVRFGTDANSAGFNTEVLRQNDYDLEKVIAANPGTTLDFGSEFRPVEQLEMILGHHPNFNEFKEIVSNGMPYRMSRELSEEDRLKELKAVLKRGNHKSAQQNEAEAKRLLTKDVVHGFSLPILPEAVLKVKDAQAQPLGIVSQATINEKGERTNKDRLTQDLSISIEVEAASINARVNMEEYPDMFYGWCLLRLLHFIHALRFMFPNQRILIAKYDYSDAYRRICHSAKAAAQSIAVLAGIAYVALRLTFGGSPNPPTWCGFSEMVTDLSNELLMCEDWCPSDLRSPAQPITPAPKVLPDDVPFGKAEEAAVVVPTTTTSKTDGFIDDLVNVTLDTPRNRERAPHAVPLAMHCTSRPHAGNKEPIMRRSILSIIKLLAEGTHAEIQVVLGWLLDTRRFLISLPDDKFEAWLGQLIETVARGWITFSDLETLVGRLNHAATIIPLSRHFLNRIRDRQKKGLHQNQRVTLSKHELLDLELWMAFLSLAHKGISINQVIMRQPNFLMWSDSCPYGVGGYNLAGRGWRIMIPEASPLFGESSINNWLEFLGTLINVWLVCLDDPMGSRCLLALGDSTTAIGWVWRSGRVDHSSVCFEVIQETARKLASLLIDSSHVLATQHLQGTLNIVADLLSFTQTRDKFNPIAFDDPPEDVLTQRFHSYLPSQIPSNFVISHLPNEILSWVTQQMVLLESSLIQSRKKATKMTTEPGVAGRAFVPKPEWVMTPSSLLYPETNPNWLPGPFSHSIATLRSMNQVDLAGNVASRWSAARCAVPQAVWLRRSGIIYNQAPSTSRAARSCIPKSSPS